MIIEQLSMIFPEWLKAFMPEDLIPPDGTVIGPVREIACYDYDLDGDAVVEVLRYDIWHPQMRLCLVVRDREPDLKISRTRAAWKFYSELKRRGLDHRELLPPEIPPDYTPPDWLKRAQELVG